MNSQNLEALRIETAAALRRIERHRFIRSAHEGRLTRAEVLRWLMCAGRESRIFPIALTNILRHINDPLARKVLLENLSDENGNGNPEEAHFQHYICLLDKLGVRERDFENYREGPGIKLALELAQAVSEQPAAGISLGYMLVSEGMTPIAYGAVGLAVERFFPDLETKFFIMHVEVDEQHVAELYRAVETLPDSAFSDLLHGVDLGERGMAVLLDEALGAFDRAQPPAVG